MKIGTRITVITTVLVIAALVLYGFVSVRIRRGELRADLERQTQLLGGVLRATLEEAIQAGRYDEVGPLVRRIQEAQKSISITWVGLGGSPAAVAAPVAAAAPIDGGAAIAATSDGGTTITIDEDEDEREEPAEIVASRMARFDRLAKPKAGEASQHIEAAGRPYYAVAMSVRDADGHIAGAVDLVRDLSDVERALTATEQNVAVTVVLLGLGLALLVWLTTRRVISHPLQRLVEGIDEVSHGDLTRVILREREDEIGDLAERYNQMTANLREARVETERGVEARLALESRLRHSEKLATIGQLAAAIAHEVGTPLGVIGGRARTMEKKAADPGEVAKNAGIIAVQAARITKIIQRLLDYARKKVSVHAVVDLQAIVKDSLDFLEPQLQSSNVTVRMQPFTRDEGEGVPRTPHVLADGDELQQVTLNLVLNAMQAMPRGGTIDIATWGILRRKPGLDVAPPGRYVALEIGDEGPGIKPEDRDKIFEPFYSTKEEGGTGLGLAVCLGIVKDHDGWIEIDNGARGGSLFRVFLPAPDHDVEPEARTTKEGST